MLTVVKVGGGLAREAGDGALRALCAALSEAGARHPLLVVPGGGGFADAVRDHDRRFGLRPRTAHAMAIVAMDQFGRLLGDLIAGAELCTEPTAGRAVRVLLPARLLADSDALPATWDVTSDSIAAWVARAAGAERLVLVKAVDGLYREWPPLGAPLERLSAAQLDALAPAGVDAHLPRVLRTPTWVIGGRRPARLLELLDTGRTRGTFLTPRV